MVSNMALSIMTLPKILTLSSFEFMFVLSCIVSSGSFVLKTVSVSTYVGLLPSEFRHAVIVDSGTK